MKYKFDSMGRFVDYEFVVEFVEEFLPTLITYSGFSRKETIEEVDDDGNVIKREINLPLTYTYLDGEIKLTSLNGYPFIKDYFFNKLSIFFANIDYDKDSDYKPSKYLNDDEIALLHTIGVDVPVDKNIFDPNIIQEDSKEKKTNSKPILYNSFYIEHTKEQVTFLLDNLSELSYILDLIINNLDKQKKNTLINMKENKYLNEYNDDEYYKTNDNDLNSLLLYLKDDSPTKYTIPSVTDLDFKTTKIEVIYKKIKNVVLSKKDDKSKCLNDEEYLDLFIKYKIIELQQRFVYKILNEVKEHHSFCRKLELIKTREIFSVRFSNLLLQKDIDTSTVLSWLGITPQTLSDYKRSKTLPDNTKLIILSKNFGVSIDYLLGLSDLKDHKYYPAFKCFNIFGFTPEAFDSLYYLKNEHPWNYAHIITTINLLLEEKGLSTLNDITDYLTHRLSKDYYTLNAEDVETLENNIIRLLESNEKNSSDGIKKILKDFKINLPLSSIDNLDATTLLAIQQNLINLKNHTTKNIDLVEEQIRPYFEKIWLKDDDFITDNSDFLDNDYIDEDEEPF